MMASYYQHILALCALIVAFTAAGLPAQDAPVTIDSGGPISALAFSPNGKTLASAGLGSIKLWDVETCKVKITIMQRYATSVAFSPDGKSVASGGVDTTIKIWAVKARISRP